MQNILLVYRVQVRSNRFEIRLSKLELDSIKSEASRLNLSASAYIRMKVVVINGTEGGMQRDES